MINIGPSALSGESYIMKRDKIRSVLFDDISFTWQDEG